MNWMFWLGLALAALAIATAFGLWRRGLAARARASRLGALLDALDGLEAAIKRYRLHMQVIQAEPATGAPSKALAALDSSAPMQEALRGVLAHRLWIRDHAASATDNALAEALAATGERRVWLDARLAELDRALATVNAAKNANSDQASPCA